MGWKSLNTGISTSQQIYLHKSEGVRKIHNHHSRKVFATYMDVFLLCHYLRLFLSFVSVILLFATKYTLQQDAGSKQFCRTNSTRKFDKKNWNKNNKKIKTLAHFYC